MFRLTNGILLRTNLEKCIMIKGDIKPWNKREVSNKIRQLTPVQRETYIAVLSRLFLTRETHSNTVARVLGIDGRKVQARLDRLVRMGLLESSIKDGKLYYKNKLDKNMKPITRELKLLSPLLAEAEKTGKLIVHISACSDYNPYPIVFTPEQLVDEIKSGRWLAVRWGLEEPSVVKKAILDRIIKLQHSLIRL